MTTHVKDITRLRGLGSIPIDFSVLRSLYSEYASPANKIAQLCKQGLLIRIQKDTYLVSELISGEHPNLHLIANHLYGPSYISLESALQEHDMIPEAVYSVESITLKRSKQLSTQLGVFRYHHVPPEYYSIGLQTYRTKDDYSYLMASPEKALCDHFVSTDRLQVRSRKAMLEYLVEFMRIEPENLATMDLDIVNEAASAGVKRQTLLYLREALEWLG